MFLKCKKHTQTSIKLSLCKKLNCKNVVQTSSSPFCEECISKFEATKREQEKYEAKKDLLRSAAVELPVKYETTSRINQNHIETRDYNNRNMTTNSKLYNVNNFSLRNGHSERIGSNDLDNEFDTVSSYNYNQQYANRYRPSLVNSSNYNSPSYSGTKEKCLLCYKNYQNTSRYYGTKDDGICNTCIYRLRNR